MITMSNEAGQETITSVVEVLEELDQDNTIPKNVKTKLQEIRQTLQEDTEMSIKANKALSDLDEINDDPNLHSYTRTQIWNIVSMLEKV